MLTALVLFLEIVLSVCIVFMGSSLMFRAEDKHSYWIGVCALIVGVYRLVTEVAVPITYMVLG